MSWPQIALISLSIFWLGLGILLTKWSRHSHKSISQHSASSRESFMFFTPVQSLVGIITYLFIIKWFVPTFNLSFVFVILYSFVAWLQIISAFIPDTGSGLKSKVHSIMAYSFALGMICSSIILGINSNIPTLARMLFGLTSVFMLYAAMRYLNAKSRSESVHDYLTIQVIYIVSFQVSVLVATFLS
jgi:hypothetical protein